MTCSSADNCQRSTHCRTRLLRVRYGLVGRGRLNVRTWSDEWHFRRMTDLALLGVRHHDARVIKQTGRTAHLSSAFS